MAVCMWCIVTQSPSGFYCTTHLLEHFPDYSLRDEECVCVKVLRVRRGKRVLTCLSARASSGKLSLPPCDSCSCACMCACLQPRGERPRGCFPGGPLPLLQRRSSLCALLWFVNICIYLPESCENEDDPPRCPGQNTELFAGGTVGIRRKKDFQFLFIQREEFTHSESVGGLVGSAPPLDCEGVSGGW